MGILIIMIIACVLPVKADVDIVANIDSEKIQEHCLDKQRVRDLIGKLEERRTGLFSDRNWPDIMRAELGLEKKYIMGADFAKGKDKTTKGNFK